MGNWLKDAGRSASTQVSRVASSMELETAQSLIVVRRQTYGSFSYLEITPHPLVEAVSQQLAKAYHQAGQTNVEVGDYMAYVTRLYPLGDITGDGVTYLIGADAAQSPPAGGMTAVLVPERAVEGDENFWHLILREQI